MRVKAFVHEASIGLTPGLDPATIGAAVTTGLCGSVEHENGCRWPHNNALEPNGDTVVFRTLFVAPEAEEREVRTRIRSALRSSEDWFVISDRARPLQSNEHPVSKRLDPNARERSPRVARLPDPQGGTARRAPGVDAGGCDVWP
jgi:hypothetical protein